MPDEGLVRAAAQLTAEGALIVTRGAMTKATEIGVPQCIAVVDAGGNLLSFVRMDGGKVLSQFSATQKAVTAASNRAPTGGMDSDLSVKISLATQGRLINVKGGLPIEVDGQVVGAVGVGSGTGEQDVDVGQAGIDALLEALGR
ncbi:MAG: heme-binding protein [Actinomycetota bacterium]|nr:heme-binding protein [Actinomycetota bacterium]